MHARQINCRDTDERCFTTLYQFVTKAFYIHLSKSLLKEEEGRISSLKSCGGSCGVSSVTERMPEVQFISNSQELDTPGQREKILRAGSFS